MKKGVLIAIAVLLLLMFLGCSRISEIASPAGATSPKVIRKAEIGSNWEMRHISLEIGAGEEVPVLLKIADGDKVDGYFYLEQGSNIDFKITANSVIYQPKAQDGGNPKGVTSDRFSFTASQAQGGSYTLSFRNAASASDKTRVVVFLEVIYPNTSLVFTLLEPK